MDITRRAHLSGALGLAGLSTLPLPAVGAAIPLQGIGKKIKHISFSDQGGRPDGVQVMYNREHVYVGHLYSNGITTLDARDPRNLKPVNYFSGGPNTRSHHLQVANDLLLAVNGVCLTPRKLADGSFDPADPLSNFRHGLSINDISKPDQPREIAFLDIPGMGLNRLWWVGGRYAYVSAHFTGYTDDILCIVDMQNPTKPEIVSKWWLPGMWTAGGEKSPAPKGRRFALHHMIVANGIGYGAWRDGGFTILDVNDPARPKLLSYINWSPPFGGGTHTPLPLPGRKLAIVADEPETDFCVDGVFHNWVLDVEVPTNPVPIATLPTPRSMDFCKIGKFGPHNLHENRPGSFQSENIIFATYQDAGVHVFDITDQFQPKEIASWIPPVPPTVSDPDPKAHHQALTCDCYVRPDGMMFVSDWNGGMHVLQYQG